jgi:hypothetical protein
VTSQPDPNGFRNTVVHSSGSQSSSFFSFQRPQQPQAPAGNGQFTTFNQFQPASTTPSQFSQFPASTTPFAQFGQFQQPQPNRFQQLQQPQQPQQPFTAFNNSPNQSPRFTDRPSPTIGGQNVFTPGSQLQQAFFSVFNQQQPQRAQRAIDSAETSSEVADDSAESASYHFPTAEFGGFVPLSKRGQVN